MSSCRCTISSSGKLLTGSICLLAVAAPLCPRELCNFMCCCVPADGVEVSLDSQLLEEGGALAVGAAAGATAAIVEQEPRRRSTSPSMGTSLKRVLQAAAAVVGSPKLSRPLELLARRSSDTGRRRSNVGEPEVVLPPVPMHPADKVLSMQVSRLCCFGLQLLCLSYVVHLAHAGDVWSLLCCIGKQ
jgi:hypothetical protein